jgi:hypothetical protein
MDRLQAQEYKARYQLVNLITQQEARELSAEEKLHQLAVMVSASFNLGWTESMQAGEQEIRQRWIQLKKKHV